MFRKVLLASVAAIGLVTTLVPGDVHARSPQNAGDDVDGVYGATTQAKRTKYYRLGVRGWNTDGGFSIKSVVPGSRATRLGKNGAITLEAGDRVVEVDGIKLDEQYTLQDAITASSGRIDLKIWDNRYGKYRTFKGVKLDVVQVK